MAVDEHDELPEATQREAKLQRQIDDLQGQVTRLHRTREETNPELSSEFQILKEKLDEHSKQLEQSAEKLSQLESENLTLRDENQALNAASNKKRRFRTQVRPMPTLETPNSGAGANLPTTAPGGDASTREKAMDAQTYDVEDIDSEPEPDKEASDGAARAESPMITHLYQMFSDRLDGYPHLYIARFNQEKVAIPECSIPTAISAFKRGLLSDGDLYKELTKYQGKTMEYVLSRAWAQVKWGEDVASRAKAQQKQDPKTIRPDQPSETRNPLKDQLETPETETGAGTRTGRSRRQKG
ncbi:hypothetical protein DY000_02031781 [Brassica cretica]|uniref:Factor of DNA methylation 1-5/IDN2 domain-containing protein n=1 Tax=Brassica cretica TaxID=69181 RepID=A0ABQ7DHX1_BRACR|nr:hypothetical protein DY000_02031781 [Brassica cretica]